MKTYNLLYVADYAVMSITVNGPEGWTERQFIEEADTVMAGYARFPEQFHLDEVREYDNE